MTTSVCVLAVASRTPLGLTAETSAAAAHAGISRIGEQPHLLDRRGRPVLAARDAKLDGSLRGVTRMLALGRPVLGQLVDRVTASSRYEPAVTVLLGAPESRPGFTEHDGATLVAELARGPSRALSRLDVRIAGRGHAGALRALADGFAIVTLGRAELCFVGGVDSWLDPASLAWLERQGRLAGEGRRGHVYPGEAAALLALGTKQVARRLGLPPLAEVAGVGLATEPRRVGSEQEVLGEGLTEAIQAAMTTSRGPVEEVYGDLDGQRYRSEEWGFAQLRAHAMFRTKAPCHAFAGGWGDCGAAVGALHCIQAVHAWQRGHSRSSSVMVWGSSEGGQRAAVLLRAVDERG
jgi:3-oxoacyl-[acyl-carrier-protein] synthase-1